MIKMKVFILLFLSAAFVHPTKIGVLDNVFKPKGIAVYKKFLYVTDQESVFQLDLDDTVQKNRFSGKGFGPGEFPYTPLIQVSSDKLIVYVSMKFAFFQLDGKLIKEKTLSYPFFRIGEVGNRIVLSKKDYSTTGEPFSLSSIVIFDKNLKKIRTIVSKNTSFKKVGTKKNRPLVNPLYDFRTYKDYIYFVDGDKGFRIEKYDRDGVLIKVIEKEYEKEKISEAFKRRRLEEHKSIPQVKKRWNFLKKNFNYTFPEYFPAIKEFFLNDDRIYVKTYREKPGKQHYLILSLKGDKLGEVYLPTAKERLWTISNGIFYYLIENEDEENWEFHSLPIQFGSGIRK